MRELVRGYGFATFETAKDSGHLASVTAELSGFLRAFESSDDLRTALTDGSLTATVRRDIVIDLLSDRVASETSNLLSYAVRFERPGEFSSTLGGLILMGEESSQDLTPEVQAELNPASRPAATRERIRGYAERVLQELAALDEIDEVEDELFRFARILDDNMSLRRVLVDPNTSYTERAGIVSDLIASQVQPATLRMVRFVLRAGRIRDLVGIFERLVELAAAERGRRVGEVRSAVDLDEAERARLAEVLSRLVERTVEVRVILDQNVIGGMLISIGDLVIDGTVRIRFERLRDLLAQAS